MSKFFIQVQLKDKNILQFQCSGLTRQQIVFCASGFGDSFMQDPDAMETEVLISDTGESFAYKTHIICIANPLGDLTPDNW
jgi:hypothetical protein